MESHLSLSLTLHRLQLLLEKLNSWRLPFIEKKRMVTIQDFLSKFQETFAGVGIPSQIGKVGCDLRKAVYKAEDALDDYLTVRLQMQQSVHGRFLSASAYLELKKITGLLLSMLMDMQRSCREKGVVVLMKKGKGRRPTATKRDTGYSGELTEQVCGRAAEKEKIVQLLINKTEQDVVVIPVAGMGGLGKTTLARMALDDERVQAHFELKLWIDISQRFDFRTIVRKIIEGATGSNCDISDEVELQRCIRGALGSTLVLLILDDLGTENLMDRLIDILACVGSGSRIIVATQVLRFAYSKCTIEPWLLGGLSGKDCWSLFSKRAFANSREEHYPKLVHIGRDIMKMCQGVPLFVKMLGRLLFFHQRRVSEWELIREGMTWNCGFDDLLIFSYNHLKPHLKQCFAFCSLFPRGHEIEKETLIQLWMANDLLPSEEGMEFEDIGHEIFNELVMRAFFQDIRRTSNNVTTFKVNGVAHDFAQIVIGNESSWLFSSAYHLSLEPSQELLRSSRRFLETLSFPRTLRTFVLLPLHSELHHLYSEASTLYDKLTTFTVLRALDIRDWKMNSLPTQIGCLKHLRYIDLSYTSIVALPESLSSLINLQTLKLCECQSLCQLPQGMKNMINLRRLDTRGFNLLIQIPPKIGQLTRLQTLSLFIIGSETSSCSGIEELQCLKLRGSLQIRHLERVKSSSDAHHANLLGKPNLLELHLCWRDYNEGEEEIADDNTSLRKSTDTEVLKGLKPHQNLEKLWIMDYMGIHFPGWLIGTHLQNVMEIKLYGCRRCEYLPPLGQLPFLKVLNIKNLDAVEYIGNDFYGSGIYDRFPSLETLKIKNMPNLGAWLESQGKKAFQRLSKLEVAFCEKLTTMPCFPSIKDLFLDETDPMLLRSAADCASLSFLTMHGYSGLMSLPEGLLQNLTSLKSLTISHCENLEYLPVELQNLTSLEYFSYHIVLSLCPYQRTE